MNKLVGGIIGFFVIMFLYCTLSDSIFAEDITLRTTIPAPTNVPTVHYNYNGGTRSFTLGNADVNYYDTQTLTIAGARAGTFYKVSFYGPCMAGTTVPNNRPYVTVGIDETTPNGTMLPFYEYLIGNGTQDFQAGVNYQMVNIIAICQVNASGAITFRMYAKTGGTNCAFSIAASAIYAEEINYIFEPV